MEFQRQHQRQQQFMDKTDRLHDINEMSSSINNSFTLPSSTVTVISLSSKPTSSLTSGLSSPLVGTPSVINDTTNTKTTTTMMTTTSTLKSTQSLPYSTLTTSVFDRISGLAGGTGEGITELQLFSDTLKRKYDEMNKYCQEDCNSLQSHKDSNASKLCCSVSSF